MRKVVLYIAMSLDGYIADNKGGVDWLKGDGSDNEHQGSYPEFIKTIDTVILGHTTYHQIATELSPEVWMYEGKMTYVITHKEYENKEEIIFTDENVSDLIMKLKREEGKDIWICGGANIINQLLQTDLIDRFCFTFIPIILGNGIRLFDILNKELPLTFMSTQTYNGMNDLVYERRK